MKLERAARLVSVVAATTIALGACGSDSSSTSAAPSAAASPSPSAVGNSQNVTDGVSTLTPPSPGTYSFDLTGGQLADPNLPDPGPRPATGSFIVDRAEDSPDGKVQRSRRTDDTGSFQELELLFAEDGVYLRELEIRNETDQGTQAILCEPDKPVLFYPATLGEGTTWTASGECGNTGSLSYEARVEGSEAVTLGDGTVVDTVKVSQKTNLSGEDASGTTELAIWFSPELHMQVKLDADVSVLYSVYNLTGRQQDLLQSTTPA